MTQRLRVLVSAFACRPGSGSENEVGWHWAHEAARDHDVWVMTEERNRPAIEAEVARGGSHPQFIYHGLSIAGRPIRRWIPGLRPYYLLWQRSAARKARALHEEVRFDVAHHLTYASVRYPSLLSQLEIPYVWGPVGGGERAPLSFYRGYPPLGVVATGLRDLSNLVTRFDPLMRQTARRAAVRVATTPESADLIRQQAPGDVIIEPNIRAVVSDTACVTIDPAREQLRLLFVGRLNHYKGVNFAIDAVARARRLGADATLTVVGAGPELARLRARVHRAGVGEAIEFRGYVPHDQMAAIYRDHDALMFPSLRDSGGFAVVEAMAQGLPVICLGIGGPAVAVDESCGFVVPATSEAGAIAGMADAIVTLAGDRALIEQMGRSALERVRERYSAERTRERLNEFYELALVRAGASRDRA